jgi:hypothetical protein
VHRENQDARGPIPLPDVTHGLEASVKVEKLNPTVQVVHYDTIELDQGRTEKTAVRFVLDQSGAVVEVNRNEKSLLQTLRKTRNAG